MKKHRSELAKVLVEVRSGIKEGKELEKLYEKTISGDLSVDKIRDFIEIFSDIHEKTTFADMLTDRGVEYIGSGSTTTLNQIKMNNIDSEIYILFFNENERGDKSTIHNLSQNKYHFMKMIKDHQDQTKSIDASPDNQGKIKLFVAVDLQMRPKLADEEGMEPGTRISLFINGNYAILDLLMKSEETPNKLCLAKCQPSRMQMTRTKPNKRVNLELRCPGSISGYCDNQDHTWICNKCEEMIEYGFDGYFYCDCGKAPIDCYSYKCTNDKHGSIFLSFKKLDLDQLLSKIRPMKEINILILGQAGVGKSTWINSVVNYMAFKSLDEAANNNLLGLIPSSFTMDDKNFDQREVKIGSDENEVHSKAQSTTQCPKAYDIDWGTTLVRLIDTPGIGDTKGIDQNNNFDEILRFIAKFSELHGICILLKANDGPMNENFQFCIKELLTHLHKGASDNIVFCFTSARSTSNRPGDTLTVLKSLLQEYKDVKMDLSKHTIYCIDNESFRFLCAKHNGIHFDEKEKNNFADMWDISVAETIRLFKHVDGLIPHLTKDTISLNDARKVILGLTRQMGEMIKNIQTHIAIIEGKKQEALSLDLSQKDLLEKLYVPQIVLVPKELKSPRTACTSSKCVQYHTIPGTNERIVEYIMHCHDECDCLIGEEEIIHPNPQIKNCKAMNRNYNCKKCGCSWEWHMRINYEYEIQRENKLEQNIKDQIDSNKSRVEEVKMFITELENKIQQINEEQTKMTDISLKFGCFLKFTAIIPCNDPFKEYLMFQIEMETTKVRVKIFNILSRFQIAFQFSAQLESTVYGRIQLLYLKKP